MRKQRRRSRGGLAAAQGCQDVFPIQPPHQAILCNHRQGLVELVSLPDQGRIFRLQVGNSLFEASAAALVVGISSAFFQLCDAGRVDSPPTLATKVARLVRPKRCCTRTTVPALQVLRAGRL